MIMNKKTRALTEEQYRKIITTINEGFVTAAGERVKPNSRIATALTLEANLGLRISDILHLTIDVMMVIFLFQHIVQDVIGMKML